MDQLKLEQQTLNQNYVITAHDVEKIKNDFATLTNTNVKVPYMFCAPRQNPWFAGRLSEIEELTGLLHVDDGAARKPEVNIAAVCGLGGVGKTSLATEYAQQKKDYYTGGVYWFSGEDDTAFEASVYDVAATFGSQNDSFRLTLSNTLAKIARNENPWLIVLDNMDQLNLSADIVKLLSGPWQNHASGHLLITTRRKPTALAIDIRGFDETCCLSLNCFEIEEGKNFLFRRIGIVHDDEVETEAEKLVQQLGGLPLALEQAGAYIKSLSCTISEYLEQYNLQRLRLLNRQKTTPVTVYESTERLAVRTTWHLNFEHIRKTVEDGKAACKFLYASAFLNANEIQKDIINIGEPPVEDEEFKECVKTTLGCQQVLKLLTDFSLFGKTFSSNLSVHHLVQEVIRNDLNSEEQLKSICDAIRMLHYAFRNCPSPDELPSYQREERPSIVSTEQSRFYRWNKLCMHSYDLVDHLKKAITRPNNDTANLFQPETARVIYECAVHLSVNSKHDKAKEVSNFANEIFNLSNTQVIQGSLFPHIIPLPEITRRHIQYLCSAPSDIKQHECGDSAKMQSNFVISEQLEEMRMKGNDLFKKGFYNGALKIYCDAINASNNTPLFDVKLLSNRASVFLQLEQYEKALQDAEEYILRCPKCWRGYARKALALVELDDFQGAQIAASLAYYYNRNLFRDFGPFKTKFGSSLEKQLFVCHDSSDLSHALSTVTFCSYGRKSPTNNSKYLPVIILANSDSPISLHAMDFPRSYKACGMTMLSIHNCILLGSEGQCSVTFDDNLYVCIGDVFVAHNVSFRSGFSNCHFLTDSVVNLTHCSFQSSNDAATCFCCKGKLKADFCKFYNCTKGGLLVVGDAEIEHSEFFQNAMALEVREGGRLFVRNSSMYGNKMHGLLVGPRAKKCVVEDCKLYDNEWNGIFVHDCDSDITINRNQIYDNDQSGVSVTTDSNVAVMENTILRNSDWGILIDGTSQAVVKKNKINDNQCGGICVNTISSMVQKVTISKRKSVIEYNEICFNSGPGINEEGLPSKRIGNHLQGNKDERNQSTAQSEVKVCYFCKNPENNLKKCSKCYTARYCGKKCQENDWGNHKKFCNRLLSEGSIVLNYVRSPMMDIYLPANSGVDFHGKTFPVIYKTATRGANLLPVGPQHCSPPNTKTWFIIKVAAGDEVEAGKGHDPSEVRLYDRSLKLDGILTGADKVYHLVWKHGAMGQLRNDWKKLFMWAKGPEDGKLRVFTKEFPPYQNW